MALAGLKLSRSGYYRKHPKKQATSWRGLENQRKGRPFPGYSLSLQGEKAPDSLILEILRRYREKEEFQNQGGCKALSRYILRDHGLRVNAKKIYRLCREFDLLLHFTYHPWNLRKGIKKAIFRIFQYLFSRKRGFVRFALL